MSGRRARLGAVVSVASIALAGGEAHARADAKTQAATSDRFRPLRSAAASATSFLQNNWNRYQENYHPNYVLDENPATAWVEGVEGYGEGQSLTIPLSPLTSARALRLRIWNGYQKSKDLFAKNAMPRNIRVTVLDPTGGEVTARDVELQQAWGAQTVVIDIPPRRGLSAVRIAIASAYPGTKYKDTCISDVLVDVDSDVPHNAVAENAKLAALRAWIGERNQTAAYFASKPAEFPFAFTHFAKSAEEALSRAEFKRRFAEADVVRAKLGGTRYKPVIKKRIRSQPDGLSWGNDAVSFDILDFLQLFSLSEVALFETTEPVSFHRREDQGPGVFSEEWTTSLRAAYADGAKKRVSALAFDRKQTATERTTWTSDRKLLLVYDDAGRLQRVYRENDDVPDFDYQWIRSSEIYSFSYDRAGKVTKAELLVYKSWLDNEATKQERDRKATRVVFTGVGTGADVPNVPDVEKQPP